MDEYKLDATGSAIVDANGGLLMATEILEMLDLEMPPIRECLPNLRFSRVPVQPILRLSGEFPGSLKLEYVVRKGAECRPALPYADQFVFGSTWHPVDLTKRTAVGECLTSLDLKIGPVSASDALAVVAILDQRGLVIEAYSLSDAGKHAGVRPLPEGLHAVLFPYQRVGFARLCEFANGGLGGLLADEMGLGKTLQAIALLVELRQRTLVVAPASLLENWQREINRFAPSLEVFRHSGPQRPGISSRWAEFDVVLTTYETVVNDIGIFTDVEWPLVVLDEAQQIRNSESQRSVAVKRLERKRGLAITGTPVENSLSDLWSLTEFILPGLLGGLEIFRERFPDEDSAARRLGSIVAPVAIRRRVAEVAQDLPDRVDRWIAFELGPDSRSEYQSIAEARNPFEANTALRVLCAHADAQMLVQARFEATAKAVRLVEILEEIFEREEKVLIFASFTAAIERIVMMLHSKFPNRFFEVITGEVAADDRQRIIDRFHSSNVAGALVLNPHAAGIGLNITAANHVVHFNPEYNPAVTSQATARVFRRGQTRTVFVHHFYYVDSVEERSVAISSDKAEIASALDQGMANPSGRSGVE